MIHKEKKIAKHIKEKSIKKAVDDAKRFNFKYVRFDNLITTQTQNINKYRSCDVIILI